MKKEMMNGVQGPPGAVESNAKNGRKEAQEAQKGNSFLVPLALFRGHSVGANPDRLDSRPARRADLSRQSRFATAEAAAAKAGQTSQTHAQDVKLS